MIPSRRRSKTFRMSASDRWNSEIPGRRIPNSSTKYRTCSIRQKTNGQAFFPKMKLLNFPTAISPSVCPGLQDIKLFNSNLLVVDEAFEYLVNKSAKGEKGQYFTPRHVIDMCVQMLNPQPGEYMIDTAAGSCGFSCAYHLSTNGASVQ